MTMKRADAWHDPLKLKPREISILNGAIASIFEFGIPDHLPPQGKGSQNAALALIEKGYLTRSDAKTSPPNDWIVVRFTEENRQKILADAKLLDGREHNEIPERDNG